MFLNSRVVKNKKYYYLEENLSIYKTKKRFSVFLGNSLSLSNFLKAFDELRNKVVIFSAKQVFKKYNPKKLTINDLINLEILKYNLKVFKKYFKESYSSFEEDEFIRFAQGSASVEGNSISLNEATLLIKNDIVIQGKTLSEIKEIENLKLTRNIIIKKPKLTEALIKKIHKQVMNGFPSKSPGEYRDGPIFITGSKVIPPKASKVPILMKQLIDWYNKNKQKLHTVELVSYFHAKFESIHAFKDGNGRTGRELLNLILLNNNYPRIIINKNNRLTYINILEKVQVSNDYINLTNFIYNLLIERKKIVDKIIDDHKEEIFNNLKK